MPRRFEYVDRPLCVCGEPLAAGSRARRAVFPWGHVTFVRCEPCGSWCQSPQVAAASLAEWYDSDEYQGSQERRGSGYAHYLGDEAARVSEARRRHARDLAPYLPPQGGRVLEIGCATGSLLAAAREAGHEVVGVDLSRRFAEAARELHGLDVRLGDILSVDLPEAHFDMIVALGTISNLSEAGAALDRAGRLLRPQGRLVLNFPTADSIVARLYGARFWMFAPTVSALLSERGCRLALARAGFEVFRVRTDRQMPSLPKLMTHARLGSLLPVVEWLGLDGTVLPLSVPIPGVRIMWAKATQSSALERA